MEQGYQILQKQNQILSQKQLQSLNILAMDYVELGMFLQSEYLENPMLEQTEGVEKEYIQGSQGAGTIQESNEENKWNKCFKNETEDLKTYLKNQLKIGLYDKDSLRILEYMILCLEDTGYFTVPVDEVAKTCGVSEEKILWALSELRQLEPVGVFSANLKECLLRQLEVLGTEDEMLEKIIADYLEDVAEGNISRISRALHISTAQVRKYILMIETLNPRPVMGFGEQKSEYIVPDIILRKDEKWEIILNDSWYGKYEISDYYQKMMDETKDEELKAYFLNKAQRARFILKNIEQRRKTLLNLMEKILERQKDYFEGTGSLTPMTMTEIAEQMGVHPSTVSRAVRGKYVQYPQKTVLLKSLFSQGISKETDQINATEIKERLRKLIKEENRQKPYSDQKLKELLEEQEISISRRAVAKYREEMGIKGSFDRKI